MQDRCLTGLVQIYIKVIFVKSKKKLIKIKIVPLSVLKLSLTFSLFSFLQRIFESLNRSLSFLFVFFNPESWVHLPQVVLSLPQANLFLSVN